MNNLTADTHRVLKKFGIFLATGYWLLAIVLIFPVAAQSGKEHATTIKIGKHSGFMRIVFSGMPDEYIQKASVILTGNNNIKVDFQSPVTLKTHDKGIPKSEVPVEISPGVRISVKESSCSITVENLDDINVSKLSTPARLVIDAYISKPAKEERAIIDTPIEGSSIPMETFIIDPGHGGYDSGIRGKNFVEKDFVMLFARDFSHILEKKGKKVFLTRKGDQVLSIKDRVKAANQKSPEIFISLHISSKNEFGIYTAPKMPKAMTIQSQSQTEKASEHDSDKNIANAIANNIKNELGVNVRYERMPLPVIANVNAPALLIELPNPEKFHYDKKNKERLINIVLKGIASSSSQVLPFKNGKGQVSAGGK